MSSPAAPQSPNSGIGDAPQPDRDVEQAQDGSQAQNPSKPPSVLKKIFMEQLGMKDNLFSTILLAILILVTSWVVLYVIADDEVLPGGSLFTLIVVVIVSYIVGLLVALIKLPPLLGMLITGVVCKSCGLFNVSSSYDRVISISRDVALNVILIKAGLGLDPLALKRLKWVVLKLAIFPCLAEGIGGAIFGHFIAGLPWLWGLLLGFLLSPVSPAVVVPTLLWLQERGYGEDKGISTLVIAASSFDDIFSISCFGVFLAIIFSHGGSLTEQILQGPLEVIAGLAMGIIWGMVMALIPHKKTSLLAAKRTALLFLGGCIFILGSKRINFDGAGPLATVTSAFVAGLIWKMQTPPEVTNSVKNAFTGFWTVMQPILFSLIGTEIDVTTLEASTIGKGIGVILLALAVRMIVCFLMLIGGNLTWKEIIFVNLAWVPKATVQAALSAQPLELARKEADAGDDINRSMFLLTTAVIAILITAPIGSILISLTGPRFLTKSERPKKLKEITARPENS